MESFKPSKFPFANRLNCRQWRSDTDLQSSLPPIQNRIEETKSKQLNSSGIRPSRPGTPNVCRGQTLFSCGKTSRLSPRTSPKRLSLSLDLRPVIEGTCLGRHSGGLADSSTNDEWSPRPCVRSLPPSPALQRSLHRSLRHVSTDSEQVDDKFKDDRILNWIRDVSGKTFDQNSNIDDDDEEVFNSSYEAKTTEDPCVTGLPVIQEGQKV